MVVYKYLFVHCAREIGKMGYLWDIYNSLESDECAADCKWMFNGRKEYKNRNVEMRKIEQLVNAKRGKEKNI